MHRSGNSPLRLSPLPGGDGRAHFRREFIRQLATFEVRELTVKEQRLLQLLDGRGAPTLTRALDDRTLELSGTADRPLSTILIRNLQLSERVRIAAAIAEAIAHWHSRDVLHLGLCPEVVLLNADYAIAELHDLSTSELFSRDSAGVDSTRKPWAHAHFLAPEQGFQFTHSIDNRTDLYSLGCLIYGLLTGQPPFAELNLAHEVSYAHVAREVDWTLVTTELAPQETLDALIAVACKLLEKDPADRYQSAVAVSRDLARIRQADLVSLMSFMPARHNLPQRLFLPDRLYGREEEVKTLLAAFMRVEKGPSEALLVAGYSGVGKSALVYEVQAPILRNNGLFVWGKFDQLRSASPYSAIAQAFGHFLRTLLALPSAEVQQWRQTLHDALYPNAQILIDIMPELGTLLGPQPEPSPLDAEKQQNRFNAVFLQFVHTICIERKPLVVFIDDLQWADLASINLLRLLFSDVQSRYCLLLGAYRDNEVDAGHPFVQMLAAVNQDGHRVAQISLEPLSPHWLEALLSDALKLPHEEVTSLATLVHEKTRGNPFFLRQFLFELYREDLLRLDEDAERWVWSVQEIRARSITDNVVDLMIQRIARLPQAAQELLRLSACIGARFSRRLARVVLPMAAFDETLDAVRAAGLLLSERAPGTDSEDSASYRFLHDRVQQAAYSMVAEDERPVVHHRIGSALLDALPEAEWDENAYALAAHLNQAGAALRPEQRPLLAAINLAAARRAYGATAYALAVRYLEQFEGLQDAVTDQSTHSAAALLRLESLYLAGEYATAEQYKKTALAACRSPAQRTRLVDVLVTQYTRYGELERAIAEGLAGLQELGQPLPEQPDMETIAAKIGTVRELLAQTSFADLAARAPVEDARLNLVIDVLIAMQPCCYNSGSLIFPITILELLELIIRHGNCAHSSYVFMMYALLCTKVLKDYETAIDAEKHAGIVGERFPPTPLVEGRLRMMRSNFVMPWGRPLQESAEERDQAYHLCLEQGDYYWGVHAYMFGFYADLFVAARLGPLLERTRNVVSTCRKIKQPAQVYLSQLQVNLLEILSGTLDNQHNLDHEPGFEQQAHEFYQQTNYMCGKYDRLLGRLLQGYLFGNYRPALQVSLAAELGPDDLDEGIFHEAAYTIFNLLCLTALELEGGTPEPHWQTWRTQALGRLARWLDLNPATFQSPGKLLDAEQALLEQRWGDALADFERAIDAAERSGFALFQALANERCGRARARNGQVEHALPYLRESIRLYRAWGAEAKAVDIEAWCQKLSASEDSYIPGVSIDWQQVVIASQQLSGKLDEATLSALIQSWIAAVTGAQRVVLYEKDSDGVWRTGSFTSDGQFVAAPEDAEVPETVLNFCANSGERLLLKDACRDGDFQLDPYVQAYRCRALLALPVRLQGEEVLAAVLLEHRLTPGLFTPRHTGVVELLLAQYVISLNNSRLYRSLETINQGLEDEVRARTQELADKNEALTQAQARVNDDLEAARALQHAILPSAFPPYPGSTGAALMLPALSLSGDFYDFIELADGRVGVIMADVSGKGVQAAFFMAIARTHLQTLAREHADPGACLMAANQLLCAQNPMTLFVTVFYAIYDPRTGDLQFTNAGHTLPVIARHDGQVELLSDGDGPVVGIIEGLEYSTQRTQLAPGESLVLYTDGVTEAFNPAGEEFGIQRLMEVITCAGSANAETLAESLLKATEEFAAGAPQSDDITVAVIARSRTTTGD